MPTLIDKLCSYVRNNSACHSMATVFRHMKTAWIKSLAVSLAVVAVAHGTDAAMHWWKTLRRLSVPLNVADLSDLSLLSPAFKTTQCFQNTSYLDISSTDLTFHQPHNLNTTNSFQIRCYRHCLRRGVIKRIVNIDDSFWCMPLKAKYHARLQQNCFQLSHVFFTSWSPHRTDHEILFYFFFVLLRFVWGCWRV